MQYPLRNDRLPPVNMRPEYYPEQGAEPVEEHKTRRRSLGRTELSEEKRSRKTDKLDGQKLAGQLKLSDLMAKRPPPAKAHPEHVRSPSFGIRGQQHEHPSTISPRTNFRTELAEQYPQNHLKSSKKSEHDSAMKRTLTERALLTYHTQVHSPKLASDPRAKHEQIQIALRRSHDKTSQLDDFGSKGMIKKKQAMQKILAEEGLDTPEEVSFVGGQSMQTMRTSNNQPTQAQLAVSQDFIEPLEPNMLTSKQTNRTSKEELNVSNATSKYDLRMVSSVGSRRSEGNISLNSKISSIRNRKSTYTPALTNDGDLIERVEVHLNIIECFLENTQWIEQYYRGDAEWELVKFYSFNRYYIERERAVGSLVRPNESCFILNDIEISKEELKLVHRLPGTAKFVAELQSENREVRKRLDDYFESLPLKPYSSISLHHTNSCQMIKECNLELQGLLMLLKARITPHERDIYQQRVISIMQLVFLIEELDGDFIKSFTESIEVLNFSKYIDENWKLYEEVLAIRC